MISQTQIDEIIEKNEIVSVVSEYVKLTRRGSDETGLCPFHQEKTPSFHVRHNEQYFKCFGCGKGGNVVHFIMLAENLDFPGALEFLANRVGIKLETKGNDREEERLNLKNNILSVNKMAARFYYENLKNSPEGREYFRKRGISPEILRKFGLGFANDKWTDLFDTFTSPKYGIKPELLVSAGLVVKNEDKSRYYDRFRNRVMFPIFDPFGAVIGFGGRVMDDSKPKYLNSSETAAYSKSYSLYGFNFARKSGSRRIILVEGYMDCIALHQKGIDWAVASLGTALTQSQARLIKRSFDEVYIGYDSDGAGQDATIRGLDILQQQGLRVKVLDLGVVDKNVKDPDEFLRKHPAEDFMKVIDGALPLVLFKIKVLSVKFPPSHADTLIEFLKRVSGIIALEKSASVRDVYINEVGEKYGVDRMALSKDVEAALGKESQDSDSAARRPVIRNNAEKTDEKPQKTKLEADMDMLEKRLILYLADNPAEIRLFNTWKKEDFTEEENWKLYSALVERGQKGEKMGRDGLLSMCSLEMAEAIMKEADKVSVNTSVKEIVSRLEAGHRELKLKMLTAALKDSSSPEEKKVLMTQISELAKKTGKK